MKQYLSPEQTAQLIELGFEKPKSIEKVTYIEQYGCGYETAYSIGELIGFCPRLIKDGSDYVTIEISHDTAHWIAGYKDFDDRLTYATSSSELIDAIFDLLIKLHYYDRID